MQKENYQRTMNACFVAYMVQAIVNNFVPLLFVTFQTTYEIPMTKITLLITLNFLVQLIVDLFSAGFVDKIGYRASVIIAHVSAVLGFVLLTILPGVVPDAFVGILIAVMVYAVGGGLIEVLISPIMEACPTENKEKAMSLLHSFYCWGHVAVVLLSTAFFVVFGIHNWKVLAILWAMVPLANIFLFAGAPIYSLHEEDEKGMSLKELFREKIFWVLMVMMICAGAAEQAVSQWASLFAEKGLSVSKTIGDLAGPMSFAIMMGISRLIYGKYGHKMDLNRFITGSCLLCIFTYLCIVFVPNATINLLGCAVCGFSVGIFWPGTFSKASAMLRRGGTVMFAFLALAGDVGCSGGPTLAGLVSSLFDNDLKMGILAAIVFPILLLVGLAVLQKGEKKSVDIRKTNDYNSQ
ncbi:MAG: MFS transporter [Eubacterium sp.]